MYYVLDTMLETLLHVLWVAQHAGDTITCIMGRKTCWRHYYMYYVLHTMLETLLHVLRVAQHAGDTIACIMCCTPCWRHY